jgi:hypothetical protein
MRNGLDRTALFGFDGALFEVRGDCFHFDNRIIVTHLVYVGTGVDTKTAGGAEIRIDYSTHGILRIVSEKVVSLLTRQNII